MDAEETITFCWLFGLSGVLAVAVLQALYWWQAAEVRSARDSFFLRSVHALIPTLLWATYALLLRDPSLAGPAPPTATPQALPHLALLTGSVVAGVSLSGLALSLLPYTVRTSRVWARIVLWACWVPSLLLPLLSLLLLQSPPSSLLEPARLLGLAAALTSMAAAGYSSASGLTQLVSAGCGPLWSKAVGAAEVARSALWAAYGASSSDPLLTYSFVAAAAMDALYLAACIVMDYSAEASLNGRTRAGQGEYELVPGSRAELLEAPEGLPAHLPVSTAGDRPGPLLHFDDIDEEFEEWLQKDIVLGKRVH